MNQIGTEAQCAEAMEASKQTGSNEIVLDSPQPKKLCPIAKKHGDHSRFKTRVNIGYEFERWKQLRDQKGFKTDADLANFLLNR